MKTDSDEDLLAGSMPEPTVAKKVAKDRLPTAKNRIAKKAKALVEKHEAKRVNGRRVIVPGIDKRPTLTHKQVDVLAALSLGTLTAIALCTEVTGKADQTSRETFQKTTLGPLVKDGLVLKVATDAKLPPEYCLNKNKVGAASVKKTLDATPLGMDNAISAGFLGGIVFGKPTASGKRDLWANVRFGRAVGAILQRLVACGAVGIYQPDRERAKLYYRNPAK